MKVAESAQYPQQSAPVTQPAKVAESVRVASDVVKASAVASPTVMDTAHFDKNRLKEATKAADKLTEFSNRRLKFEYQEDADVFQVSVVDGNNEVIRKIPTDEMIKMMENIERLLGLSVDMTV